MKNKTKQKIKTGEEITATPYNFSGSKSKELLAYCVVTFNSPLY